MLTSEMYKFVLCKDNEIEFRQKALKSNRINVKDNRNAQTMALSSKLHVKKESS